MNKLILTFLVLAVSAVALPAPPNAFSQATSLVSFPNPQTEFLIGPQLKSGTSDAPGAGWFDQTATDRGLTLCLEFPDEAHTPGNVLIPGTVSVTNGSTIVTGAGTHFLTETKDYAIIQNGAAGRLVKIRASVQSDTQLTLTLPWQGPTLSGQTMSSPSAQQVDDYLSNANYYDFIFTQYANYHRTGDQRFLDCARKAADSWWSNPWIDYGHRDVTESLAPRSIALTGLMLRALDGRPEMWPWITNFIEYQFHQWVEIRKDYPGFYYGIRDGGFMLLYAADLAAAHPDPTVRADFKTRALSVAVDYYARLQQSDGSYRWNIEDSAPGALDGMTGIEQPFMVGILNEGMIAVHRLTGDDRIKAAILKSVEHEYLRSYNPNGYRGDYYFIHGQFNNGFSCESGCGSAANPFPPADLSLIGEVRQLNATSIHQFGYAYAITLDPKYLTWGDEIFDATYSGRDGFRGLAYYRGKEYDESYRAGGRYLAWRVGGPVSTPTPSPVASPSPTATATPTPTPVASATPTPTPTPLPSPSVKPSPTPTPSPSPSLPPGKGGSKCRAWPPWKLVYCL